MTLRWLGAAAGAGGAFAYQSYVRGVLDDGLLAFFRRSPALARVVATVVDVWVEANAELLERLAKDLGDIEARLGVGVSSDGVVAGLEAGQSDPHHRGRSVALLSFASGGGVVYKPRDVTAEAAFHDFVAWCNAHGGPLDLVAPRVLGRSGYGWVERVEPRPLSDAGAAGRAIAAPERCSRSSTSSAGPMRTKRT